MQNNRKNLNWLKSIVLVFVSLLFIYSLFEFFLFKRLIVYLPLKTRWHLDEMVQSLAQYSKKSAIPKNYIAIVGDSYAEGVGDWLHGVNQSKRPAFSVSHIINERTKKDVISFGRNGAGNLEGIAYQPISQFCFIDSLYQYNIDDPDFIIVYFYEGNDLNNNLNDHPADIADLYVDKINPNSSILKEFLDDQVKLNTPDSCFINNLLFADFVFELSKDFLFSDNEEDEEDEDYLEITNNRIVIDGKIVSIPGGLQSPALELTEGELKLAVYIFEQSLVYLRDYFNSSKIGVVYIPSPLSSYELASDYVDIETYHGRDRAYPSSIVKEKSDNIAFLIEKAATDNNISYIDSRRFIWEYSDKNIIHGPKDWYHFNKVGYSILAEAIIELIDQMEVN